MRECSVFSTISGFDICFKISILIKGKPPKKLDLFGKKVPTFKNHCYVYGIFDPFLSNIFVKFTLKVSNLSFSRLVVWDGWMGTRVSSQVWDFFQKKSFFRFL